VVKTHSLGRRTIAVNRGGEWTYVFQDHLGWPTLEADYDGRAGTRWKYEPYGTMRGNEWTLPIDKGFTGQIIEPGLGLHDYVARHYAQPLGRWIAPDTVVPYPADPQSLNRYSYVLHNALKYTDPTGMFSEDESMRRLDVSTWGDVPAMSGEGRVMAGAWGFLEVLWQTGLGDPISVGMTSVAE
jgi:RHS repeat-associated protein